MVRKFFSARNVLFDEFDVSRDMRALIELERISHQRGVPVIDVDGEVFVGFSRAALERALNRFS
jgi:glutaredoxin